MVFLFIYFLFFFDKSCGVIFELISQRAARLAALSSGTSSGFSDKNRCFSFEWQQFVPALPSGCCGTAIDVVLICGRFTRCGADVAQLFPHGRMRSAGALCFTGKLWRLGFRRWFCFRRGFAATHESFYLQRETDVFALLYVMLSLSV